MARFNRTRPAPSAKRHYASFRPFVRVDFQKRCAYCLTPEAWAGGAEAFQLDHFRPQAKFANLVADFYNLYWSCHVCNQRKADAWPSEEMERLGIGFVDLCEHNFESHFVLEDDGTWSGLTRAAEYTIERIALNRDHLRRLRRMFSWAQRRGIGSEFEELLLEEAWRTLSEMSTSVDAAPEPS